MEQLLWLIRLRWIAVCGIVAAGLVGTYVFPVLINPVPIYLCGGALLLVNAAYYVLATKDTAKASARDTILGFVQAEVDLLFLTAVLHFSGGVTNPFVLFFIFHVIIATIILPRNLSYSVAITAIASFALLAVNEMKGGLLLKSYPLQLSVGEGLWRNPVYALGGFVAFACSVVLTQYLTRIIIVRMTAKEMEAAKNRDVLEAVIGAMTEGVLFVGRDGKVSICNPSARVWTGDKDAGTEAVSINDFPMVLADYLKSLVATEGGADSCSDRFEFEVSGSENRRIEARGCPVRGNENELLGYVFVGEDLTEHTRLEAELRKRTEDVTAINEMLRMSRVRMAQREKMVAIGQMATGIAHEIGNPLASISSVTQYLARKAVGHEEKEYLLGIEYQVNRISNILRRMLSMSRPATEEYKWVDINELIENTLAIVRFDKRMEKVNVQNEPAPDLPMVWLDPQAFEQVLLNVFINAMDAMEAKSDWKEHTLTVTKNCDNEVVEIRVGDTGIGMSPEVCRRAFESFFTTKEISKGTGLGLFICYNLVTEIDGTIELESEPAVGTTVIIRISVRPKRNFVRHEQAAPEGQTDG